MSINLNEVVISGTVVSDPVFSGDGPGAWGFLNIETSYTIRLPDGKFVDEPVVVPIVADQDRFTNTMRKYIKAGKALAVKGYYRNWMANGAQQHGICVTNFVFAKANSTQQQQN